MLAHAQELSYTPYHANGTYDVGEKAGWTLALAGTPAAITRYDYVVKRNNFDVIETGTIDLASGSAKIEATLDEPGMLYVELSPSDPGAADAEKKKIHLGAAIAPWKLKPSAPKPADFDAFWAEKLAELNKIPMDPVLTPVETKTAGVELYTVKLASVGSHVQGYLAKPAREGKFPALVIFQWAGVYALQPQASTGRAAQGWLVFNVDSHDMAPDQATGVSQGYNAIGNTSRETSYFLNMYLRDSRAIDYIASRPEWDGKTLVILGTSMGGQQSLAAAGLNPRVTAVLVNEPAGADGNGELHGRKAGYPNWPADNPEAMKTAPYFDTVNFATRIHAPVLAAIGYIDVVCPPVGIWTAVDQIPGAKEVIPMVESNHNNLTPQKQGAWDARSKEVLGILLSGEPFVPAGWQ
ncbi:MAG TPA: acetylxylan esterase [Bryobacteraceae bacterium]